MKKSKEILHKIKTSKLLKIELIVTILELILGTLLHFIYEWSGNNAIIASFMGTFKISFLSYANIRINRVLFCKKYC